MANPGVVSVFSTFLELPSILDEDRSLLPFFFASALITAGVPNEALTFSLLFFSVSELAGVPNKARSSYLLVDPGAAAVFSSRSGLPSILGEDRSLLRFFFASELITAGFSNEARTFLLPFFSASELTDVPNKARGSLLALFSPSEPTTWIPNKARSSLPFNSLPFDDDLHSPSSEGRSSFSRLAFFEKPEPEFKFERSSADDDGALAFSFFDLDFSTDASLCLLDPEAGTLVVRFCWLPNLAFRGIGVEIDFDRGVRLYGEVDLARVAGEVDDDVPRVRVAITSVVSIVVQVLVDFFLPVDDVMSLLLPLLLGVPTLLWPMFLGLLLCEEERARVLLLLPLLLLLLGVTTLLRPILVYFGLFLCEKERASVIFYYSSEKHAAATL